MRTMDDGQWTMADDGLSSVVCGRFESFHHSRTAHFEQERFFPRLAGDQIQIADSVFAAVGLDGLNPLVDAGFVQIAQAAVNRDILLGICFDVHELQVACEGRINFIGREDMDQRGFVSATEQLTQA